jgi:hypothetical protein
MGQEQKWAARRSRSLALKMIATGMPHLLKNKRKNGLVKKAIELSILCDCEVALVIFNSNGRLIQYSSGNIDQTLSKFIDENPVELYTNDMVRCKNLNALQFFKHSCSCMIPSRQQSHSWCVRLFFAYFFRDRELRASWPYQYISRNGACFRFSAVHACDPRSDHHLFIEMPAGVNENTDHDFLRANSHVWYFRDAWLQERWKARNEAYRARKFGGAILRRCTRKDVNVVLGNFCTRHYCLGDEIRIKLSQLPQLHRAWVQGWRTNCFFP